MTTKNLKIISEKKLKRCVRCGGWYAATSNSNTCGEKCRKERARDKAYATNLVKNWKKHTTNRILEECSKIIIKYSVLENELVSRGIDIEALVAGKTKKVKT